MESEQTQPGIPGEKHPTLAELKDASLPHVHSHLASCSMCRSVVASSDDPNSGPIELDLPKGLVSENAFKWPADPIARGGMAQIFAGEDRRLGRTVILKAPRDGDDLSPGMAQLFQRRVTTEARILAKLQHPSIVTIYELGKSTVGWPFCVLERVEGDSLRDRLDELADLETDGKPRTRERLELLSNLVAIAEALAYAHERKVVHRDCTPNNIILGKRGEATLIDWGIARDLEAPGDGDAHSLNDQPPSMSGRMVTISAGTPPYLPLEQSQGRAAQPSFDVYSFGVTLYEVVSGTTPFEWKTVEGPGARTKQLLSFLDWLKHGDPAPPAMPKDTELSGIIAKAIVHDPAQRFTADELVRALKQYLTGDLVFSHRYSRTGRLARWARTHKATTVAIGSLVAFAIVGGLVWAQAQKQAKEEAELKAMASAANADASQKGRAADEATRAAEEAKVLAEEAQRQGKNADELRRDAEAKRKAAEQMRYSADAAAKAAKGQADDAFKRFQEAMRVKEEAERARDQANAAQVEAERLREASRLAQAVAEKERDGAKAARESAERERESAKQSAAAAEAERDAARTGQSRAEQDRESARAAATNAERDRDAAIAARASVERERDEARRRINELEQRLRDAQNGPQGPPGPPPPNPGGP